MSTPARTPGKYGRRPADPANLARAIRFSNIRRAGAAVTPPAAVDYIAAMNGGWLMLGNGPDNTVAPGFEGCGDCEGVRWSNTRRVMSTVLGPTATPPVAPHYPPWPQVLTIYKTQNPDFDPVGNPDTTGPGSPADGGMDTQTLLEWLNANPGAVDGGELIGFALVDHTNLEEVQAAIDAGGLLWLDINVQDAQQTQFGNDQPWNYVAGSPVDGGHAVPLGGYGASPAGSNPDLAGPWKFETWCEESSMTASFWSKLVEQLWFPIWKEQLGTAEFQAGVDLAAFAAEYTAATGKPFPVTVPPPAPVPTPPTPVPTPPTPVPTPPTPVPTPPTPVPVPPTPVPTPPVPTPGPDAADDALAAAVTGWAGQHHMSGGDRKAAAAIETWLAAKGFTGHGKPPHNG
jgi:hypothetical protein